MAFEGLQRPWSNERVLHRDSAGAAVDKPAGVPCSRRGERTRDSLHLAERPELHGWDALEVSWPVPERASGVTLLGPRALLQPGAPDAPAAEYEAAHVVAVANWGLPERGQLRSGQGARAVPLRYAVLRRRGSKALVELRGAASPPDVLGALRSARQNVIGDALDGAEAATRLMLHVSEWNGHVHAKAPLPIEFESWFVGEAALPPERFEAQLVDAALLRFGLWPKAEAFRLSGEDAGELAGVTLDRYGDYAVLSLSSEQAWSRRDALSECLMDLGARGVYVKRRVRADLRRQDPAELWPAAPQRGDAAPEALSVRNGSLGFWVRLSDGASTGLFLDQRANWARVEAACRGADLLNLFCYTGAFSVAAAVGGATSSTSVDLSRRALTNARLNLELNGLAGPSHRLLKADVVDWLARAGRAERRFDWVVLDPPSFGTRARGVLDAERDYAALVKGAAALLRPGGHLLCVSHHRKLGQGDLLSGVERACREGGRRVRVVPSVGSWDCPTLPGVGGVKSVIASFDGS
jgi:23S rRNA (cytosine1962-C5)-methyltransferase